MEVEWKAFELHPETPPEGKPRRQTGGSGEMASSLKALCDEIGIQLKRPDFTASSRLALEATEYAKEESRFEQFHAAVFKAYWLENKNIGLVSVLREIAETCGMNGDEMEGRLYDGRYAWRIDGQTREAALLGVTGIPAFIVGDYLIEGARPYDIFRLAVELNQDKG